MTIGMEEVNMAAVATIGKGHDRSSLDRKTRSLEHDLREYGLTPNQAKVYTFLVGRHEVSASEVSNGLGLHRVEVYRKLREMESLGLVERHLGYPVRFKAASPDSALDALIRRSERKISKMRMSSEDLARQLRVLEQTRRADVQPVSEDREYHYRKAVRREQYLRETGRMIEQAKQEIMSVTSSNGLLRAVHIGNLAHFKEAARRGVKVRMISEINALNKKEARRFANVIELRHSPNVHFRFLIFDRLITVLSTRFEDNALITSERDDYFVFKDSAYAATQSYLFEHLWQTALPVQDHLRLMKSQEV